MMGSVPLAIALAVTGPATVGDDPAAFVAWARGRAVPLATAVAGRPIDDLKPLSGLIGDARVVALGESTHGTREVFQMKHRLLEFLVRERGFTLFAIEAGMPACSAVNDYVLGGEGNPADLLRGLGYWTWDTEEVLDLIRWMRRYNDDPAHARKVKFYGFDMQSPEASLRLVLDYLEPHAPELTARAGNAIEPYVEKLYYLLYRKLSDDFRETYDRVVPELTDALDRDRDRLIAATSRDSWELARRQIDLLRQAEESGLAALARQPTIGPEAYRKLSNASRATAAELAAYLERHDDGMPRALRGFLDGVVAAEGNVMKGYRNAAGSADPSPRWDALAKQLAARIDDESDGLVARSSRSEWERARSQAGDLATLMGAAREIYERPQAESNVRDRCMAENVRWILDREGPDAKVVTWAHNWHVLKKPAAPGVGRMGTELDRLYGDRHIVVGFAFNRGGFQAMGTTPGKPGESSLREFVVGPAKPGSIDRTLAEVGPPLFLLGLRDLADGTEAAAWAATPRPLRDVPAGFDPDDEATYYINTPLSREFDAVVFLETTSRARPNPKPDQGYGTPAPDRPASALNLDFEAVSSSGSLPDGWSIGRDSEGYAIVADDAVRDSGERSLRIRREARGGKAGLALTGLPAATLAGKTVRIRGRIRTEGVTRGYAGLVLRAEAPGTLLAEQNGAMQIQGVGRSATEFLGLLGTDDWRDFAISLTIPPAATVVRFGPILTGGGTAWYDRLAVEVDGQPYAP